MRKIIAIFLLGIFLVNTYGYRLLLSVAERKSEMALQNTLDQDRYDDSRLFLISVPASHLSAYTNQHRFERTNGTIEVAGIVYHYVKMRLQNDSLQLLCVRDSQAMHWQSARAQFFAIVNDLDHHSEKKQPSAISKSNVPSDFIAEVIDFTISHQISGCLLSKNADYASPLSWHSYPLIDNPPEIFI